MLTEKLSLHTGVSTHEMERLLSLSFLELEQDSTYLALSNSLDLDPLKQSHQEVLRILDEQLPSVVTSLIQNYQLTYVPLDASMLSHMIFGYASTAVQIQHLYTVHELVPPGAMRDSVVPILDILGTVPDYADVWQRTFAIMIIPLIVKV